MKLNDIDRLALKTAAVDTDSGYPLDRAVVLAGRYGWEITGDRWRYQRLDPEAIGASKYNIGQVALSKSLRKLVDEGLLSGDRGQGYAITEKGRAVLAEIQAA